MNQSSMRFFIRQHQSSRVQYHECQAFTRAPPLAKKTASLIKKETSLEPILNSVIVIYVISLVGAAGSRSHEKLM